MPVTITIKDERTIEVPVGAKNSDLEAVAQFIDDCAKHDYALTDVRTLMGGNQRDETVRGVRLVILRSLC
jgi:hypothetical protein